ncbi:Pyruvate kinase [Mortierella sp. GBA39]|nr:Pyruvate kinase [Mortierella sp. GBA39]
MLDTNSVEMLNKLRDAGMNIVRMYHQSVIDNTRKSCQEHPGRPVGIALDTKGPEIRTGLVKDDVDVPITAGHRLIITTDDKYAEASTGDHMYVDYKNLSKVITPGKVIYVDDGVRSCKVLEIDGTDVKVEAINNGKICSRKGVNLPKTDVDLPALSEKDKDLLFGVKNNADITFASFISRADDVREIRKVFGEEGKHIKIICKIENLQGVKNVDEILEETDGIMVARGDLGIEVPCAQVFIAQKIMISKCNLAGKPVICATQMLESMTYNPPPTRAEVSDVANAVLDGVDCAMLSGETAKGSYPLEALRQLQKRPVETTETVASSAVSASQEQKAGAIIVLSTSGDTARLVSKYRPQANIIIVTRKESTARSIHLFRGRYPFIHKVSKHEDGQEDVDRRLRWGMDQAIGVGLLQAG